MIKIHKLLADAKSDCTDDNTRAMCRSCVANIAFAQNAVAMAEALAQIHILGDAIHLRDPAYCAGQMAAIASDCITKIEKEVNHEHK